MHHRIELLGDDGFAWVRAEAGGGEVEQRREVDNRCARRDRVAEPDIHLEPNLGGRHTGDDFDADAAVLLFLSNEPHSEGVEVELHAIVGDLEPQDLFKRRTNGCNARLAESEQVEVSSRPMWMAGPHREEGCPLQHEAGCVGRRRQPEEQPLVCVAREQQLKILAPLVSDAQQSCAHGSADVLERSLGHASASRYGRMNA